MAVQEKLQSYNPFWKFFMIKSVVFFSYWQSFIISILLKLGFLGDPHNEIDVKKSIFYNDYFILLEMAIASFAFAHVFTWEDFEDYMKQPKPILNNLSKVLSMNDLIKDAKSTFVDEEEEYERPLNDMSQEGYRISDNDEDGNDDNDDDNLTKKRKSTGGNKSKKNPFDNKL
mmetsp:Transcript_5502/g.4682  ORF Transcript_5502/g.4682 Transcript_5502/m.4682 type:complete len:172 (+) Transcript_5502:162-677(+)